MSIDARLRQLEQQQPADVPRVNIVYRQQPAPDHLLRCATNMELDRMALLARANEERRMTDAEQAEYTGIVNVLHHRSCGFPMGGAS